MKKLFALILITIFSLIISSCGPVQMERLGMANLSVTAAQSSSRLSVDDKHLVRSTGTISEEFFKEDRKEQNRGNLIYTLSAESFILDIDDITLYKKERSFYHRNKILPHVKEPRGMLIPQHYDLVHSNKIITNAFVKKSRYDGFGMKFLPGSGKFNPEGDYDIEYSTSGDGYYVLSITGIKLPKEYDEVSLQGEIVGLDELPEGLRYFSFDALQPIETHQGFLSYLIIGSDVEQSWIQNPDGKVGNWSSPLGETSGNSLALYLSSNTDLNFRLFNNPKIVINWDMEGLIEIYDNNTPDDYSDDIITYNLKDPFPVSLSFEENIKQIGSSSDNEAPKDVSIAKIAGENSINTLQWINPQDEDFKEVVITRKANQKPSNRYDGEEVYRSHVPNFVDKSGTSGVNYYYLVQTVDYSGNYSLGVTLNQVQP